MKHSCLKLKCFTLASLEREFELSGTQVWGSDGIHKGDTYMYMYMCSKMARDSVIILATTGSG